jgi:hypothetical protein
MEMAKKMVLISTENLKRMQRQLQQQHPITDEALENTQNSENSESANNSVQTPGTPLSRLDVEMSQILNSPIPRDESERWKMYKEVPWRYLHFTRENEFVSKGRNTVLKYKSVDDQIIIVEHIFIKFLYY